MPRAKTPELSAEQAAKYRQQELERMSAAIARTIRAALEKQGFTFYGERPMTILNPDQFGCFDVRISARIQEAIARRFE